MYVAFPLVACLAGGHFMKGGDFSSLMISVMSYCADDIAELLSWAAAAAAAIHITAGVV